MLVFLVFAIYAGIRFLDTDVASEQILWGAVFFLMLGSVMSMKIWYWMEMQKNQMIREIKRVELQVANLASKLSEKEPRSTIRRRAVRPSGRTALTTFVIVDTTRPGSSRSDRSIFPPNRLTRRCPWPAYGHSHPNAPPVSSP
ncbi:MAG: hypothetical protein IIA50_06665 [Bacteroidetes bacterium]|nr:hypothetical protein [Bacteroidota bacterium]